MRQRPLSVAARDDAQTSSLQRRVVEMHHRRQDTVLFVWEERVVLMQREWRTAFRRLDEQLRVVQLDVRADEIGDRIHQAWIGQQAGERANLELGVVAVQQLGRLAAVRGPGASYVASMPWCLVSRSISA
jgi:sugar diacid utilization regulator